MANNRGPQTKSLNVQYEEILQDIEEEEVEEGDATESSGLGPSFRRADDGGTTASSQRSVNAGGSSFVTKAFERMVNPFMQVLDVDGMMSKIDVNDIMSRVNWNDVIDDIEWNDLMEHVDVDALINRIDVNAVVERVDVNAVIERSNLKSIIARSTAGICFLATDTIRAMCIKADQVLQRWGRCADCFWWRSDYKKWVLPPLPTVTPINRKRDRRADRKLRASMECPRKSTHLAIAVQGRNAGVCTRCCAFIIDKGLTVGFAFLFILIFARLWELAFPENEPEITHHTNTDQIMTPEAAEFVGKSLQAGNMTLQQLKDYWDGLDAAQVEVTQKDQLFFVVGLPLIIVFIFGFLGDAFCLAVIGRTVGKVIMGLVVLDSSGGRIGKLTIYQSILRAFLTNLGFITIIGAFISMGREDRRGIIDLICGTTVVYAWDAKRFRLADDDIAKDMPFGDLESQQKSDGTGGPDNRAPYLRQKTWRNNKKNNKKRTETLMISVPAVGMSDHQGRANRMNRASAGTSPSSELFAA